MDTLVIDFSLSDGASPNGVSINGSDISRTGADRYLLSSIERLQLTGTSKNDVLYNVVVGHDDVFIGNAGNDFLGGNGGSDRLIGGEGNDTFNASGTSFNLNATGAVDGRDVVDGGPGDDLLEAIAINNISLLRHRCGCGVRDRRRARVRYIRGRLLQSNRAHRLERRHARRTSSFSMAPS